MKKKKKDERKTLQLPAVHHKWAKEGGVYFGHSGPSSYVQELIEDDRKRVVAHLRLSLSSGLGGLSKNDFSLIYK